MVVVFVWLLFLMLGLGFRLRFVGDVLGLTLRLRLVGVVTLLGFALLCLRCIVVVRMIMTIWR